MVDSRDPEAAFRSTIGGVAILRRPERISVHRRLPSDLPVEVEVVRRTRNALSVEIVEHRDAVAAKPHVRGVEQEASPRSQCFF